MLVGGGERWWDGGVLVEWAGECWWDGGECWWDGGVLVEWGVSVGGMGR